jgi:hypothetical protein
MLMPDCGVRLRAAGDLPDGDVKQVDGESGKYERDRIRDLQAAGDERHSGTRDQQHQHQFDYGSG